MTDSIVLPCGVVLTRVEPWQYLDYRCIVAGLTLRIYQDHHAAWNAGDFGGGYCVYKTREEAVANLDSRVIALRAALLPSDARERVARALWEHSAGENCPWTWETLPSGTKIACLDEADAVVAALGGGR